MSDLRFPWVGLLAWLSSLAFLRPDPHAPAYAAALLGLAACVLVPLALAAAKRNWSRRFMACRFAAGLLLLGALALPPGWPALLLTLPWAACMGLLALFGLRLLLNIRWRHLRRRADDAVTAGACMMGAVGAGWLLADRFGFAPMGFHPEIVQLTAVHFHFAAFALPLALVPAMREKTGAGLAKLAGFGVLLAMPVTAAGITAVQAHGAPAWVESASAMPMVLVGLLAAAVFLRLGALLFLLAGLALLSGMILAFLYAWRGHWPAPVDDLLVWPFMRAWHGSANALGFGLLALVGWWMKRRTDERHTPERLTSCG